MLPWKVNFQWNSLKLHSKCSQRHNWRQGDSPLLSLSFLNQSRWTSDLRCTTGDWNDLGPSVTIPVHFSCSELCAYKDTYSPGFMSFRRTKQTRTLHLIARLVFRLTSYHQALWLSYIGPEQWLENGWVCPPGWEIRNIVPGPQEGETRPFCA